MIKLHDLQITGLVLTCFIRDHLQHYAQGQNLLWLNVLHTGGGRSTKVTLFPANCGQSHMHKLSNNRC